MKRRHRYGLPQGYGRDRYRVHLKSTARHSIDPQQLSMDLRAKPAPPSAQWPEHQTDLEDYLAMLGEKPKP